MSNSALVNFTLLSPHCSPRNHAIDTITIHCMAGNLTVQSCGNVFQTKKASSNYGIDSKGNIGLYVPENKQSWATSSDSNDDRAITIEVANTVAADPWPISDAAYASLINLLEDVCRRNGIKKLLWRGDKSLIGRVDQQNMTVHRWFAAKACPGETLYNLHSKIASDVNSRLEEDEMAKIVEQIAQQAGVTTDEAIKRLAILVAAQDTTEDQYQKDGVNYLKVEGIISASRDGRSQVNWGDFGTVLKRLMEKHKDSASMK